MGLATILAVLSTAALLAPTLGAQTSRLEVEHSWPTGMTAHVCLEHDFQVTCGWEMEVTFGQPLTDMEIWDATIVAMTADAASGGTKVVLKNKHWAGSHGTGDCTRFNAHYRSGQGVPPVSARFVSACDGGQVQTVDDDPQQSSELEVEHSWPGGMTAAICLEHDFKVNCGWEIALTFARSITSMEIWDAVIISTSQDRRTVSLGHLTWSKRHRSGTCHRFNAFFPGAFPVGVTAKVTKYCFRREWVVLDGGDDGPEEPTREPKPADYEVKIESSWDRGVAGEICLFHTVNITCGFEAEIIFSAPIRKLEMWSVAIIDRQRNGREDRYKLKNLLWTEAQPDNPTCHRFNAFHNRRNKPHTITAHYTKTCHEGETNDNPNEGGTLPPPTTPTPPTSSSTSSASPSPTTSASTASTSSSPPSSTPSSPSPSSSPSSSSPSSSSSSSSPSPSSSTSSPSSSASTSAGPSSSSSSTASTASTSSTTASTSSSTSTTQGPVSGFDYRSALSKSMLFYFVQRSGPITDTIIPWRAADSAMQDGSDVGRDLTGGWYDAGDHVKFGFPMAASATNLLWGFLQWKDAYDNMNQTQSMLKLLKHPLDYFLKCWNNADQVFYGQVGSGHIDHAVWGRPEDMTMPRPAFKLDTANGGSDLAAETAAALAAGALAFQLEDSGYAIQMLTAAVQLYDFADQNRREYHLSIPDAGDFYKSHSGYHDELCWGAAWLLKASGREEYRVKAESAMNSMDQNPTEFSWDSKAIGCYVLMHEQSTGSKKAEYAAKITAFLDRWLGFKNGITKTPCGLAWLRQWGSLRYSANAALIALMAADQGVQPTASREWAEGQVKYMLGANRDGFSYQVGYGTRFPLQPHHQSASCPASPAVCDWGTFNSNQPNAFELTGALVGGPDSGDNYQDRRSDYIKNEVTTDYNAGFQSVLAGLVSLDMRDLLPDVTPVCPRP